MPTYEEALQVIQDLVRRRVEGDRNREIKPTDRIQDDLGLDSLAVMEFASDVEIRFDVSIPSEMFESIRTVEDVTRAVLSLEKRA
jgi:acyl carrier protein